MRRYILTTVLPFLGLALICVILSFLSKLLGFGWPGYLKWYLNAGPIIGLAQVVFAVSWDGLDKNTDLVSAHPLKYIGACLKMVGLPLVALGGHLKTENQDRTNLWDVMITKLFSLLFTMVAFAWLFLIAPLQYFLFLICGAPSRVALNSKYRLRAELDNNNILDTVESEHSSAETESGWDASMRNKPVTIANAFGVAVLLIIGYLQTAASK